MGSVFNSGGSAFAGGGGGAVTAVANGANNRITTFSSETALNGEANLTFDGSALNVTGDLVTTGSITSGAALYASEFMYHTGDTNTKLQFTLDQINLIAGDVNMIKLKEDTQNTCVFFEGGDDVDFRIEAASAAYFMYINSGENKMFIGGNTANKLTDHMFNVQDGNIALGRNSADAIGAEVIFAKSRNATDGSHTVVQPGDILGEITFKGSDGDESHMAARIVSKIDYGTPGNNDMPGMLSFYTGEASSTTPLEALRLNQGQHVVVPNGSLMIQGAANGTELGGGTNVFAGMFFDYIPTAYNSKDGGRIIIRGDVSNNDRGTFTITQGKANNTSNLESLQIDSNGNVKVTGGTVGTVSDERIKENVVTLPTIIDKIKSLNPVEFDWKDPIKNTDPTRTSNHDFGFIAQELEQIFPDVIYTGPETTDVMPDNLKHVSYSSLIAILVKGIQELETRITALEG